MSIATTWDTTLTQLDQYRAVLLGTVVDALTYSLPMVGIPSTVPDFATYHQQHISDIVNRLHDSLQAVRLHEQLLIDEFTWMVHQLTRNGLQLPHIAEVIDQYVVTAQALGTWKPDQLQHLDAIRSYLYDLAQSALTHSSAEH